MDMRVPQLSIKTLLESDPLTSRILVRRLAVSQRGVRTWQGGTNTPRPTGVCEKNTPPDEKTCGNISLQNARSGAERTFCRCVAGQGLAQKECAVHRHRYA